MNAAFKTLAAVLLLSGLVCAQKPVQVDEKLPKYERTAGVSGTLTSVGSDTLNNLMTYWSEGFRRFYPSVVLQVEGKGSNTAPPALTRGVSQLGPMSRLMKPSELETFEKAKGYKPTAIPVAIDALAVYVHKDNPIAKRGLTLKELDGIFSQTRKTGAPDYTRWGQLGLEGRYSNMAISIYGRNSASGTYSYFRKVGLKGGDYRDVVKETPGSSGVVNGVSTDLASIGYSGIGYRTSSVAAVPIAKKEGKPFYDPTKAEDVYSGKYPISRFLYVYVDRPSGKELDLATRELFRFILSQQGQAAVVRGGYLPLRQKEARRAMRALGIR